MLGVSDMADRASEAELIKLPVSKLTRGMFVAAIENNGKVAVANAEIGRAHV